MIKNLNRLEADVNPQRLSLKFTEDNCIDSMTNRFTFDYMRYARHLEKNDLFMSDDNENRRQ